MFTFCLHFSIFAYFIKGRKYFTYLMFQTLDHDLVVDEDSNMSLNISDKMVSDIGGFCVEPHN